MKLTDLRPHHAAPSLVLTLTLLTGAGCVHTAQPVVRSPQVQNEQRLQSQIDQLQDLIRTWTQSVQSAEETYWNLMEVEWRAKVRAARASESNPAERRRYLEASRDVLARRLQSLQVEMKIYEEFLTAKPPPPRK